MKLALGNEWADVEKGLAHRGPFPWPLRPALLSAVPSIIFRVGFWGPGALKAGGDPGSYIGADGKHAHGCGLLAGRDRINLVQQLTRLERCCGLLTGRDRIHSNPLWPVKP